MERGVWLHLETTAGLELLKEPLSLWADLAASAGQPFGAFPRSQESDLLLAERLEAHAQEQVRSIMAAQKRSPHESEVPRPSRLRQRRLLRAPEAHALGAPQGDSSH